MLIKVKKEYLTELDDMELSTYVTMLALCHRNTNNYISLNNVVHLIYGDLRRNQQVRRQHSSAISSLITKGVISGNKIGKSEWEIDLPDSANWRYYTTLTPEEIEPIFSSNYRNKLSMMRVLITVLMCRSKRTKYRVCDVSVSLLCKESGKSSSTVQRALDNLIELGALHKARICDHRANIYGLPSDSSYVDKYAASTAKRLGKREAHNDERSEATNSEYNEATFDDLCEIFGMDEGQRMWNKFLREDNFPSIEEVRVAAGIDTN